MKTFFVYTDGGAVGNPGPGAIAIVVKNNEQKTIFEYNEFIGNTTNNQAEYRALIKGLEIIKDLKKNSQAKIEVLMDSELIVNQLNLKYKVKNHGLQPLFLKAHNLAISLGKITFRHIYREENHEADKLVKKAIKERNNV